MPHQKKYTEGTANRTMTFLKKDLDILQAHTGYRETLTDLVQQAIKEYIKRNGWDQERRDKATIPEPTKPAEPEKPDDRNKRDPIDLDPPNKRDPIDLDPPNKRDPIDLDPPGQPEPEKPDDRFDGLPDYLKTD